MVEAVEPPEGGSTCMIQRNQLPPEQADRPRRKDNSTDLKFMLEKWAEVRFLYSEWLILLPYLVSSADAGLRMSIRQALTNLRMGLLSLPTATTARQSLIRWTGVIWNAQSAILV